MHSASSNLYFVKKILCQKFAGTRTSDELKSIQRFIVDETEIIHDHLWKILPQSQKLQLCAYFRYSCVNEDHLIHLKDPSNNHSNVKLLILVKGSGELVCGDHILALDSCHGRNPCLGAIHFPDNVRKLIDLSLPEENQLKNSANTFQIFMQKVHEANETSLNIGRPSILLHKGSHYIYLNHLDCQLFMERLFDRQISQRVLHRFHCNSLRMQKLEFLTFPKDQPIIIQGWRYDKIILTLRGTCQLSANLHKNILKFDNKKKPESESLEFDRGSENVLKISQVGPMSFLGFLPFFMDEMCVQPISVIALTKVRVLVLDARELISQIKSSQTIFESFHDLSRRQVQWLEKQIKIHYALTQKGKTEKLKTAEGEDDLSFPSSSVEEIESIIHAKVKKNPRLSKHKLLHEFKRLVRCEEKAEHIEEYEDLFLRFDFKDECMREIEDILGKDWESNDNDEESDLIPFPSILLSRKFHGKTLPPVKLSNGYLNPFKSSI